MASYFNITLLLTVLTLLLHLLLLSPPTLASDEAKEASTDCKTGHSGECHNKPEAQRLKLIAIFSILISSILGVDIPLFTRSVPALHPDRNLFVIVKAFASGIILATGNIHVMPDSFDNLNSPCLPENPWRKFPFTTFVAMISAVFTLMVDSFMMSFSDRNKRSVANVTCHESSTAAAAAESLPVFHGHRHGHSIELPLSKEEAVESKLRRNRIIAQVLEMGIVVHSVVIGLSMGASENPCTIRPLVTALCFHQLFEGMGLGGVILQAEYGLKMKLILAFFFSTTTPFGIALGMGLSNVYADNSPTALIVVGLLNACSAGLLNYMALVDLLALDFMGPKLQNNIKLQGWAYVAVLLGAGGISLMAKWA